MSSVEPPLGPDIHSLDLTDFREERFCGTDDELRIAVDEAAWERIQAHAAENVEFEVCGVLVGEVGKDGQGPFVLVKDCICGRMAHQASDHVTFTHSTWEHIHNEKDEKHPDLRVVGWYHTHPGIGVFLSEPDLFAHRSFFDAAWQVALVLDPRAGRESFFFWERGDVVRSRRFWVGDTTRWEPPERAATGRPPAVTHTALPKQEEDEEEGTSDNRWWDSATLRLGPWFALPVLLVVLLLVQWNTREATARLSRNVDALRFEMARGGGDPGIALARELATWVRGRLDQGESAELHLDRFREILRLDPARGGAYRRLLPELSALLDED